jgi:hypothetical protein
MARIQVTIDQSLSSAGAYDQAYDEGGAMVMTMAVEMAIRQVIKRPKTRSGPMIGRNTESMSIISGTRRGGGTEKLTANMKVGIAATQVARTGLGSTLIRR